MNSYRRVSPGGFFKELSIGTEQNSEESLICPISWRHQVFLFCPAKTAVSAQAEVSGQRSFGCTGVWWARWKGPAWICCFLLFKKKFALAKAYSGDRKTWGNGNKMCTLFLLKKTQYNSIINKPSQTSINSSWNLSKERSGGFARAHSARVKFFCLLFSHLSLPWSIKLSSKGSKGKQGTRGERRRGNPGLWLSTFWWLYKHRGWMKSCCKITCPFMHRVEEESYTTKLNLNYHMPNWH